MNKGDKAFLIASFAVIILLLFAVGSLYMVKEGERDKRIGLQKQLDALSIEKQNLEARLKEAEVANAHAESNIKFQEEKVNMLSREIEEQKAANSNHLAKIQEKELQIQNLKSKIDEVKSEKQGVLRDLDKLYQHHLKTEFQLENLTKTKEELEKKAKEIAEKEGVSLGTVVIKQSRN